MPNDTVLTTKPGTADAGSNNATLTASRGPRRRSRQRRTTGDRVREALLQMCGGHASLLTHEEKAWASITFTGTRHEVMLDFYGAEAVQAGETFIADLPEYEFRIPGQLVADATITSVDHRFGADERMVVTASLLLLEES